MARPSKKRGARKAKDPLLGMAVKLVGIGVVLLVVAGVFRSHTLLAGAATDFTTPAMLAIGLGAVLLAGRFLFKRNRSEGQASLNSGNSGGNRSRKTSHAPGSPSLAENRRAPSELNDTLASIALHRRDSPKLMQPNAPASQWSPAVFAAIEWRRFEAVCESLFAQAGFETKAQSHGADGGVDIWLYSKNAEGPVSVVQCKHWQGKPVGVKELREFFGVMASHGLKRGTYATSSTYTAEARTFAQTNGIHAMDGTSLLALIARRTLPQQNALLAVAYEGEYWKPTCASCGIKLLERKPAKGGAAFWGCSNYPRCKTRIHMSTQG